MRVWEVSIGTAFPLIRIARLKVYSQDAVGIFVGEKPLVSLGARGKFKRS